ncbi:MAG: glycosyltransferase [Cetobacterium sp.]
MKKIKSILKSFLKSKLIGKIRTPFVKNMNLDLTRKQKRVLISYIDYFSTRNFYEGIRHTNLPESVQIINVFKEMDYIIDVVHCNAVESFKYFEKEKYDVIFGFGEIFYQISKINMDAKKIMYVTENHPELSYKNELERNKYFHKRTGKKIPLRRTGVFYKNEHFENIDATIVLGEKSPFKKYDIALYNIFPTGLINEKYKLEKRDYENSKKNFLWLGSNGAIHKGLDLLIEVFSKYPELTLHICGFNPEETYLKIPKLKNIIDYGRIDIKGENFLELAKKCSYIILPSCSEGFSTSIATGMLHSLIPIVCKDTGFNRLGEYAIYLEDYKIEYIENEILNLTRKDGELLEEKHQAIYYFSRDNFTLNKFTENFRNILREILNEEK